MRCSQPSRPESRLPASPDNSESPNPTCGKCAKGDPLEAIDRLVPWESFRADIEDVVLTPEDDTLPDARWRAGIRRPNGRAQWKLQARRLYRRRDCLP